MTAGTRRKIAEEPTDPNARARREAQACRTKREAASVHALMADEIARGRVDAGELRDRHRAFNPARLP